jgi:acyl carrier protein
VDDEIYAQVRKLVAEELSVDEAEVTPQAGFQEDLGADSLALVELVMAFEDKFEIDNIPDEDAEKIKTVKDAVEYIAARKRAAA